MPGRGQAHSLFQVRGALAGRLATAEDIDKAMCIGAGHSMGPLHTADLVGHDINLHIMETLFTETGDPKFRPSILLKQMVRANLLGRKTGKGFFEYPEKK